ncbi:MAG: hypothetical protein MUF59_10355 [Candidatus Krumholzibacteria bacterium]|jgi:hypothetical protein|nr:hypothetical protein [Candidatus Krumholzibacteria bacterium]
MKNGKIAIILAAVAVVAVAAVFLLRGSIGSRVYEKEAKALSKALPTNLALKYGEELDYTLDKFWSCYEDGIVSQNDMTDVMDRLRELKAKSRITDLDVFQFIGFVSRLYTDGINRRHQEKVQEENEAAPGVVIE